MSPHAVVVTGMGIASGVGWTLDETWQALAEGRSGLGALTLFESQRCGSLPVGQVPGSPADRSGLEGGSRSDHLAVWAARQALAQAGLAPQPYPARRAAIVLGALTGGMIFTDELLTRWHADGTVERGHLHEIPCHVSTDRVAELLGLGGFRTTVSDACASGAAALGVGRDLLLSGEADVVLAGGADCLNRVVLHGFNGLMLCAADGCRPFDRDRKGMSVGEGAGVLVLETEEHARARSARALARFVGHASSCDAHHVSAPLADGAGLLRAMRRALSDAELAPTSIGYVNAHGTGTADNDPAEALAIEALFGASVPPVSSTKRFFGHTMAAAGAIEAIVSILAMQHQAAPANLGLRTVDPAIGFEPVRELRPARIDAVMSTSLGFGGNNCAVVFEQPALGGSR